ncbi:MAG: hypothetical protein AAB455_00925 [Patescibacteria group bacterium]
MSRRQVAIHVDVPTEATEEEITLAVAIELGVRVEKCQIVDRQYRGPADYLGLSTLPLGGYDVIASIPM